MGAYLGNTEVGQMFLGSTEIGQAYLGSTKVWEKGGVTPPQPLPYDSEIEFLQTSGAQYIDTLVPANHTNEFEVDYEVVSSGALTTGLISYRPSTQSGVSKGIWVQSGKIALNTQGYDSGWKVLANGRHVAQLMATSLYVDGTLVASTNKTQDYDYEDKTNGLLRGKRGDKSNGWDDRNSVSMKLYGCKIYNQGALARDFIPVRVGEVGYLYDKVSGQLFANAGSGNFTLGNDITT